MLLAVPMAGLVVVEVRQSQPGVLPPRPPVRQRLEHRSSVISAGGLPIVAARQAGSIEAVIVLRNDLLRQRCCIPVEVLALRPPPTVVNKSHRPSSVCSVLNIALQCKFGLRVKPLFCTCTRLTVRCPEVLMFSDQYTTARSL